MFVCSSGLSEVILDTFLKDLYVLDVIKYTFMIFVSILSSIGFFTSLNGLTDWHECLSYKEIGNNLMNYVFFNEL